MEANEAQISVLFNTTGNHVFEVPKYQRDYSWRRDHWEKLFDDIASSDAGHFLGSFIFIPILSKESMAMKYELVDGQQRFTTISILMCSIFERLSSFNDKVKDDEKVHEILTHDRIDLRKSLFVNGTSGKLRYTPTEQSTNRADFEHILCTSFGKEFMPGHSMAPKYFGNRLIAKCKKYMDEQLSRFETLDEVQEFWAKLQKSSLIRIVGDNYSQSFILFETLNDRGVSLSVMDLVKSKLFGQLDTEKKDINTVFDQWKTLIDYIPDTKIQERFLRHFYNSLKGECVSEIPKQPQATGATIINIYEKIIENEAMKFFSNFQEKAKIYSALQASLGNSETLAQEIWSKKTAEELIKLNFVGAATSHSFLLWLDHIAKEKNWGREQVMSSLACYLRKWYCWRNLTGYPGTPELDRMFMKFIEELKKKIEGSASIKNGQDLINEAIALLSEKAPPKEMCEEKLSTDIYDENRGVTYYILACIEDMGETKEKKNPAWESISGGKTKMTIEHILPQSKDLPEDWVMMLVGDKHSPDPKAAAYDIQGRCLHKLGNLTLTAYNPNLSKKPFLEKRDAQNKSKSFIGFKNGLYLNSVVEPKLCDLEEWNEGLIEERTEALAKCALDVLSIWD